MKLDEVVAGLGLTGSAELLEVEWESSQQSMPADQLFFLAPEFVAEACQAIPLPAEASEAAIATSRRIASNPALEALAWHFYHCFFHCTKATYSWNNLSDWPSVETLAQTLQGEAAMFYPLVLFSGFPQMQVIHQAHAVPPEIVRDTLSSIRVRMEAYHKRHNTWGLDGCRDGFLMNHLHGELYRLSRLQFQFGSFGYRLRAFRHRVSGQVLALAEDGVRYRADGQLPRSDRDAVEGWSSQLLLTDTAIVGNPILPTGSAVQKQVQLPAMEWHQVLAPGDPVLNIHIPGGSPMACDLCGVSFRTALEFFPRHFPERPFVAICCGTWLLDAQLEELLPPTSNLVRFQQEVYLFPIVLDELHLVKSVFGCVPEDLTQAPRDTTLQRVLLDRLLAGEQFSPRGGGCFLLPDDVDWGAQVYRRNSVFRD